MSVKLHLYFPNDANQTPRCQSTQTLLPQWQSNSNCISPTTVKPQLCFLSVSHIPAVPHRRYPTQTVLTKYPPNSICISSVNSKYNFTSPLSNSSYTSPMSNHLQLFFPQCQSNLSCAPPVSVTFQLYFPNVSPSVQLHLCFANVSNSTCASQMSEQLHLCLPSVSHIPPDLFPPDVCWIPAPLPHFS